MPWCYGFPFNTGLRHPQYLGVVLTLFGTLPMLMSLGLERRILLGRFGGDGLMGDPLPFWKA